MRRFEQIVLVLFLISIAIFLYQHDLIYYKAISYLGLILAVSYFIFGAIMFKSNDQDDKRFNFWLFPFGIIFCLATFSLLFKVLFLFGWEPMNWYAILGICISLVLIFFLSKSGKIKKQSRNKLYKTSFLWLFILVITLAVPQKNYVELVFENYPEMVSALKKYTNNPENEEAASMFVKEYYKFQDDFQGINLNDE